MGEKKQQKKKQKKKHKKSNKEIFKRKDHTCYQAENFVLVGERKKLGDFLIPSPEISLLQK